MTRLRVASYNLLRYWMAHWEAGEKERYDRVAQVIDEVDAQVWCVQEVAHQEALYRLAKECGLVCAAPARYVDEDDRVAFDPGRHGLGVGLMWRPEFGVVPETLRTYSVGGVFFHGLVKVVLDLGGHQLQVASTHLTPFGAPWIVSEAKRVVSAFTRPADRPPGIVGSDSNGVTGDRLHRPGSGWGWHAPDPYAGREWIPDMIYQCEWRYDKQSGERIHWADRDAGDALWSGGLYETGAILDVPVEPTVGYWPGDPFSDRDIDHLRVTEELVSAVRTSRVHRSELTDTASDHRPKVAEFDL